MGAVSQHLSWDLEDRKDFSTDSQHPAHPHPQYIGWGRFSQPLDDGKAMFTFKEISQTRHVGACLSS